MLKRQWCRPPPGRCLRAPPRESLPAKVFQPVSVPQRLSELLLHLAAQPQSLDDFLRQALEMVAQTLAAEQAIIAVAAEGNWQSLFAEPLPSRPPVALLAQVADSGRPDRQSPWQAWPLLATQWPAAVLALKSNVPWEGIDPAVPLGDAIRIRQQLASSRRRAARLESMLELVTQWHQTLDMHRLLEEMAQASTKLLAAERATIFLWDRRTQKLVGRPALGVTDGELRIPDDTGVVGRVVQTGEPLRVGQQDTRGEISRIVDQQLQFQTRNLVCVPLVSRRGRVLGAFEVLNKNEGDFTAEDQDELSELAIHAGAAIENCRGIRALLNKNQADSRGSEDRLTSLIGDSALIVKVRDRIRRVAKSDSGGPHPGRKWHRQGNRQPDDS